MNINNQLTKQSHPLITPEHLRRLAVIYIRQATKENTGTNHQRNLATVARDYGWPDCQIEMVEDLGKSGSSAEQWTGWQRLLGLIEENLVGAVFVTDISRLSRQVLGIAFRRLAAAHNALLYTERRLVDPAVCDDTPGNISPIFADWQKRDRARARS
jgi:DNA invertase Pin-like site-specific DNA recombinase